MKQILTIGRLVFLKAWRSNFMLALLLLMLPLFYAAWLFETSNPGFQTGFLADIGGSLMSFLSGVLILILGIEHFYWPVEQRLPWFFLSRLRDRRIFVIGKFLGVALVLFFSLLVTGVGLVFLLRMSEGEWFFSLLFTALLVFFEYAMFAAVFQLFAVFMTRLSAFGSLLLVYFAGHNCNLLLSLSEAYGRLTALPTAFMLAFLPDTGLFRDNWFAVPSLATVLGITSYALLQTFFYLLCAGMILQKKDL